MNKNIIIMKIIETEEDYNDRMYENNCNVLSMFFIVCLSIGVGLILGNLIGNFILTFN